MDVDSRGNFVVAWTSNLQDGSGLGIYAQRFSAAGIALGSDFLVNTTTSGNQTFPNVVFAPNDSFLIEWEGAGTGDTDGVFYKYYSTQLSTTESGGVASFQVVLDTAPTSGVNIGVTSSDLTEGTVSPPSMTFTSSTWNTPTTIFVTGANDALVDGYINYAAVLAAATSLDTAYSGINPPDLTVTNIDNDAPIYSISGTIYEDVDGDGQVSDDGVGLANAIVSIYLDNGDGTIGAGDTIVNSLMANSSGQYTFSGLADGNYWVVVDSRSFIGSGGLNSSYSIHDQWAEQTYGSAGSVTFDGSSYSYSASSGTMFGGMRQDRSDNGASLLTGEHVTRVAVTGSNVAGVDYGFSYNVITNTRDGDEVAANNRTIQGSLRQFVQNSNALVTTQSSNFQIGTGAQTISLTSLLDDLSDTVILDATTQEGFSGTPLIVLDGNDAAGDGFHLIATADSSTIRGFVIRDFSGDAIEIMDGSDGNTIAGNYLGALTASGTDAGATEKNGESGLAISGANNTIGGSNAADRNVISGNNLEGITISGTGATGNIVVGNYIGTTASGTGDLGNGSDGILIFNGASSNTIGGLSTADRNVIAGNNEGIEINGSLTTLNVIQGNYIGLEIDGTTARGNDFDGIHVSMGAHDNTIGGTAVGARNIIAGSGANGVQIEGTGSDHNVVQGNFIGTDATGVLDRGNLGDGVRIGNGAQNNTIGGTFPEARNVISGNEGDGVDIRDMSTTGNVVQGNYIGTDSTGELDLGNTANGVNVTSSGNTIGGGATGAGNVVSGNNLRGIYVTGAGVSATIQGNYVGLDDDGLQAIGNSFDGIEVAFGAGGVTIQDNVVAANGQWGITLQGTGAGNTLIGNTVGLNRSRTIILGGAGVYVSTDGNTFTGNTIGGSNSYGIYLTGSSDNTIQGNYIGTNSTGATGIGNALQGIGIDGANSDNNLIGGTNTGEGNVIAGNSQDGISIATGAGTGISILGNTIYGNGGLAIDLHDNGVTLNDPNDTDPGANGLQNYPVISSAILNATDLYVSGLLDTDGAATQYRIEFYGNLASTADATNGEARVYLGSTTVTTNASGDATFSNVTLTGYTLGSSSSITATATRIDSPPQVGINDLLAYGSTSEMGANFAITTANSAPSFSSLNGTPTFTEGGSAVIIDADVTVSDAELTATDAYTGATLTIARTGTANPDDQLAFDGITVTTSGANVSVSGIQVGTYSFTGGQLTVTFGANSTQARLNTLLQKIVYWNTSDSPPASVQIDWTFSDGNTGSQGTGGALSATGSTTIAISSTNDAPQLISSASLNGIVEDYTTNSGTMVSTLTGLSISDPDFAALPGIAVTSVDTTNGIWEYTLDGNLWLSMGTPTSTAALLLPADATTAVRFIPNADYAGGSGLMNYRAWDQTTGTAGGTADTTVNGGSTAFSVGLNGTSVTVAAVNDAPVLTAGSVNNLIVQEDSGLTSLGLGSLAFAPGGGADEVSQTLTYQVTAIPHPTFFGTVYLADGTTPVTVGTYTLTQIQGMQFRPALNQNGGPSFFTFNVIDSGGTGNGGVNNTGFSIQLNITAANDAPSITTNTLTIAEGATVVLSSGNINATDPDNSPAQLTYTVGSLSGGQFELVASPGSSVTTFTQAQINAGAVQFVHNGGESAPTYALTVSDGSLSNGPSTVSIGSFTNVNDAPVMTAPGVPASINEDDINNAGTLVSDLVDTEVTDSDASAVKGIAVTFASTSNGTWQYTLDGTNWVSFGTPTNTSARLLAADATTRVRFVPSANFSGTSGQIFYRAWDRSSGTIGGVADVSVNGGATAFSSTFSATSLTVNPINDAPAISTNTLSITEGATVVLTSANINATDPDSSSAQLTYTASSISGGSFELVASPGTAIASFTQAQINSGAVQFVHDGGEAAPNYTLVVSDGSLASGPSTASIGTFTNINDAPVLISGSSLTSISEDPASNSGTLVSQLVDTEVSDADISASKGIAVVAVDSTDGNWQYSLDGTNWLSFGSVSATAARLLAADATTRVRFVPNTDWSGTVASGLTYYAWDRTSGSNGGTTALASSVGDTFSTVTYSNNTGTTTWSSNWIESDNNAGGAAGGLIRVVGGQLQVESGRNGDNVYRQVNLSGATTATLSLSYSNLIGAAQDDTVELQVSANGGATYSTLATFDKTSNPGSGNLNVDISAFASSNTRIRFIVTRVDATAGVLFDNVQLTWGGATGGTTAFSTSTVSSSITVTAANDPPVISFGQGDITHTEGNSTSTIDGAVSVADIDSADFAGGTLTVTVSGGDVSDQLVVQHQGTGIGQVSVSGFNLYYDSGLGSVQVGTWSGGSGSPLVITFTSVATAAEVTAVANAIGFQNFSSDPSPADRLVQFQLTDGDGGTSALASKSIHFTTVNTAPTISGPPAVTTNIDTLVTFSSTNGNAISVNDPDAGSSPIQVRLSVTTGLLSLSTTAGLTFSVGNGVSNQTMTMTGTVAAIQAAMNGLQYTPQPGFSGADRLIIEVDDLGNSGTTGTPLTDSRGVNIYVGTVPFLQGNYLEIGFNGSGSLGSTIGAPAGYQSAGSTLAAESDPERDSGTYDGDFILPGSPEEGWGVHVGGTTYSNNTTNWGTNPISGNWGAVTDTGTAQSMTWNGTVAGVDISAHHTVLREGLYLEIVVTLTNSTASTLSDLYYYRNVDPDNNYYQNSVFETTNTILSQGNNGTGRSEVTATQPDGSFISLTGFGENSRVSYGGFSNRDPLAIYNGTGLSQSGSTLSDEAISLAFHVPTLAAGQSTTLTLRYTFGNEAAPDVDLDGNDSTATGLGYQGLFAEDGGPVAIVDSDTTLFDADNDVLQGMTITLTNALDGVLESLAATTTGTNISASYDSGTGVLSLSGQDTLASYRQVLSSVVYNNSANTPNTTSRVITITVSDGSHTSPVATSTIDVLATNDPPVLLTNTLTISEGGTVVLSSSDINGSDPESPATGLTYTVSNLTGGHFESVASGATITSFTQDQINNGGIQFVHDGGEAAPAFSLTLSDGAQSVGPSVAVISFSNVNDAPVSGTSSAIANEDVSPITVVLGGTDVDGTITQVRVTTLPSNGVLYLDAARTIPIVIGTDYAATGGQLSVYFAPTLDWNGVTAFNFAAIDNSGAIDATPATATITVNAVNDAPVATMSNVAIEFTKNNPVGVMADLAVTDVDSTTLTSATVSITANFVAGEDQLSFTDMLGITGNYNAATGVLTLTGTAPLADYQTALRSIAYFNPSDNPTTAARQFQVVVSDGPSLSVAVSRSININRVNDGPTISTNALTITEGATVVLTAANLQSSDPDNSPAQLNYTITSLTGGQFEFAATPGVAITSFTQDDVNNSRVQFVHDGGNSAPSYQVTLSDGSLSAGPSSAAVTFTAVNDAPTISSITNQIIAEDNVLGPLAFTVSDSDSANLVVTAATSNGTLIPLSDIVLAGTGANRTISIIPATDLNGGPVTITLTVSDGSLTAQTSFDVTVQPINDPPTLSSATFSVSETATNGTLVGAVVAGDVDLGDTQSFSVLSGDPLGAFAINGAGQISVADSSQLDFETRATWTLTIQVQDAAGATATNTVTINLIDQNDNNPIIISNGGGSTATISLAENTTSATTVIATDADAGTVLQYSLSGPDAGLFQIDINTGVLTFLVAPDFENPADANGDNAYQITVIASDGARTDSQALTISVTEVNEFATTPIVDLNGAADTIAEDAAVGSVVGVTAFADDLDGTDTISYSLISDAGGRFTIDAITGVVTVAGALDYETSTSHTIRVQALSTDGTTAILDFTIAVTDVNEYGATAITDTDSASETLAENLAVGSPVGVTAFADDLDGTDTISYSLLNDAGGLFTIDAVTGAVTLAQALDYETSTTHTIRVQALSTDGSTTFRDFDFTITDVNEFSTTPIADLDASAETIAENTAVGTPIGITAFADDLDGTDTVSYSLLNSSGGLFAIDSVTGVVTIAGAIDYETSTSHTIRVQALSTDGSSTFRDFTITVTDINEFATTPITDLDPATEVLAENLTVGSAVGVTAFADDQDGTDTISYSLLSDAGGLFAIDAMTGIVTLNATLDYETATTHTIRVQALSTDGSSTTRDFAFVITDVNEFTTTAVTDVDAATETIAENVFVGASVGITAFADDLDGTDTISYSLLNDAGGRFAIDPVTGVVTIASAIDYETGTSHTIRVQALSTDGSSTFRNFNIAVTDVNEYATTAISDLDPASETIAENLAVGSTVGVIAFADDLDGTDTISYSLLNDAGGLFVIDSVTGVVTLAQPLDYETSNSHTIRVQTLSTDSSSTTRNFTFTVTDVNEFSTTAIGDVDSLAETIAENATVGAAVGITAFADDLDGTDTVSYSLLNDAGGRFAIDSVTGVVTVAGAIDYETGASHTIRVQAFSTDGSSTFRDFVISVTDVNEYATTSVSDTDVASDTVAENSAIGTVVGVTAFADDLDGTDAVSYSLDNDANGLVAIDPVTGVVTVNGAIDFETTPQLTFTVRATSTDTSFSTQTFTVDVLDRNDNAPVVTSGQSFAVAENSVNGTPIGVVIATDVDTLGVLQSWQITGGTGATAFVINAATGEISVADSTQLNFEVSTSFTLLVTVSDGVQTSAVQTVTINLSDVNERPTLVGGTFTVDENSSTGTPVGAISASDVDTGDLLSYSLVGGNPGGAFAIDPSTGAITVANPAMLDFESTNSFTLTAQVTDRGGLTHQQAVTITLRDLNERPTVLDGTYHIAEWSSLGTSVGTVSASDGDAGDALTYRILAGNTGGRFLIDSSTGEIRLANPANFTHESQTSFILTVEVQDLSGLTHSAQLTVLVDNVNTPPTAHDDFYSLVQFDPLVTTSIDGVLVNDNDPDSATLTLTLISGPANGTLTLNADGSFTYSSNDLFSGVDSFTYQISDGLETSSIATVTLTVGMVAPGGGSGSNNDNTDNGSSTGGGTGTTDGSGSTGGPPGVGPTRPTNPPVKVATPPRSSVDSGMVPPTESPNTDDFFSGSIEPLVNFAGDFGGRRITRVAARPIASAILSELAAVAELIPDPVQDLTLSILENHVMWNQLNSFRDDLNSQRESTALVENIVVGTTTAVSGGLTVGYVIWLIRGGSLLATMMSVMPSWISFDPLPVMDQFEEEQLDEDTESLASIVSGRK